MKSRSIILLIFIVVFGSVISNAYFFDFSRVYAQPSITITAFIPSVCGNGVVDSGEQCDGSNLNNQSCASRGYSGGNLSCNSPGPLGCTFNTSACIVSGRMGGYIPPIFTLVIFRGKAYPLSEVILLKDGQFAAASKADSGADFEISLNGLSSGNYIFSLYSTDKNNYQSNLLTFPVSIAQGITTNVSGIFIPPTIFADKTEVKQGEKITISGQSAPKAKVLITLIENNRELFSLETAADKNGVYFYNLNTSEFDYGFYTAKAKAIIDNQLISGFSHLIKFKVGKKTVLAEPPPKPTVTKGPIMGDFNNDNRINIIDFSILAYWYEKPLPPETIDINGDGKINLIDFSILAYYWTG